MQLRWPLPRKLLAAGVALGAAVAAQPAFAVAGLPNATPIADRVDGLYNLIFWITTVIFVGVWAAMAYILIRYRYRPGREAVQTHGNTALEVIWTVLPTIALIVIAIPTYKTLRFVENMPTPDLTIQVVGHQWFWEYKYPDQQIDISNADLVIPANKVVRVLVSSADVIHDWAVPEFGFKLDAIPGHVNEGWVYAKKPGTYQGYCMQLCGTLHSRMLTHVKALPEAEFNTWLKDHGAVAPLGGATASAVANAQAPEGAKVAAKPAAPKNMTPDELKKHGAEVYQANCASCHQGTGEGLPGAFPPLAGSEFTNGPAEKHIQIVLKGLNGPVTVAGKSFNGVMPPWQQLSDEDLASVITFERTSWGNHGSVVTPDQVKAQRGK